MNPALCDAGSRIHKISSKVIGDWGGGGGGHSASATMGFASVLLQFCTSCIAYMQLLKWSSLMKEIVMCNNNLRLNSKSRGVF